MKMMQPAALPSKEGITRDTTSSLARNSAANIVRLAFTSLIAIFLPAYLTRRLPQEIYGAWVLILQLGAYVNYLDFGVQTAVAKYIAEFEAAGDRRGCNRCLSAAMVVMTAAGLAGILVSLGLAREVPELFHRMPANLYSEVSISVLFVGISLSVALMASTFSAVFMGLQRYHIPMITGVVGKILFGIAICVAVYYHAGLAAMGAAVAAANLLGAAIQIVSWKKLAGHIQVAISAIDREMLKRMISYCGVLTIWSGCILIISGIDLTIVGHYSFGQVAFYSVAISPTAFVLMIFGALLAPLLPASSALSTARTPEQMGNVLLKATRLGTLVLLVTGLAVMVAGYPLLRVWVGPEYAAHSVQYLRILVVANIVRQLCAPYSTMVVATAKHAFATASTVTEAAVNLVASIWLARHFGAPGVAAGTLIGALSGMAMHFAVSMRYTKNLAISRHRLFLQGILRPAAIAIPSLLLMPEWWRAEAPTMRLPVWIAWACVTVLIAWFVSMTPDDRGMATRFTGRLRERLT
jgi:O-antigen/teichoic acid export membrane protein